MNSNIEQIFKNENFKSILLVFKTHKEKELIDIFMSYKNTIIISIDAKASIKKYYNKGIILLFILVFLDNYKSCMCRNFD